MGRREARAELMNDLTIIEKTMVLAKWELFAGLATDEVALVAALTQEGSFEPGELDHETSPGRCVHFVVEGAIELWVEGRLVRRAGAGQVAGNLGALVGESPDEMLRVAEPTRSLMLSGEDLERAVRDNPDFAMALIRALVQTVRERDTR